MKRYASADNTSVVLKQHYEKKVHELEQEKKALQVSSCFSVTVFPWFKCLAITFLFSFVIWQREIDELRHNLTKISSNSDDGAQKLKEDYLQKLNVLESQVIINCLITLNWWLLHVLASSLFALQVSELKKKQDAQAQLLRQKQKSDEAAKRLQDEIQRIKSQKVASNFIPKAILIIWCLWIITLNLLCNVGFRRFNFNIRSNKSRSSLGYGKRHERKKFFRYIWTRSYLTF